MTKRVILLGVLGTSLVAVGTIWLSCNAWFVLHAVRVAGTVTGLRGETDSEGRTMYYPIYSFEDRAHLSHRHRSGLGWNYWNHKVGEKVLLLYDPKRPNRSMVDSFGLLWLPPFCVIGLGIGFFCALRYGRSSDAEESSEEG
jgi:hypothetical protein